MKFHIFVIVFLTLIFLNPQKDYAQFKKHTKAPGLSEILTKPESVLLNFMDPSMLHMSHSLSASYSAFGGGGGMMLNSYVNTIDMKLSDKLYLRTDIGIMSSPYNTFGNNFFLNKPRFFGGAELKYNISDHSSLLFRVDYSPFRTCYNSVYPRNSFSVFDR